MSVSPPVLVVEDETVNLELVVALLEEANCQVLTATSAKDAIRVAASERPDLILMDLQLPGMTGYEATRQLKADPATTGIPVVALTADVTKGAEARAKEAGCSAFLTKPINRQALLETLRRFLPDRPRGA
jgi:two-component system cell cycle response regulator DivK